MPSKSSSRFGVAPAFREAATSALLAFGLFLPLIGFRTVQNIHNELILETRWPLLAGLVAIIAGGRFLHSLLLAPWLERRALRPRREHVRRAAGRTRVAR